MALPWVRSRKILLRKNDKGERALPVPGRPDKPAFVVAAVPIGWPIGSTVLVTSHVQASIPGPQNDYAQLISPGLYAGASFERNKPYSNKKKHFREIVETMGPNTTPRRHHEPTHISEVYDLTEDDAWILLLVQGNVRTNRDFDGEIIINEAMLTATLLG